MSFFNNHEKSRRGLFPWPVIITYLFKIDSYKIPGIIDASGMTIDWQLTKQQNYSHKYRKDVYRSRINKAYEDLNEEDKLRVAFIICEELSHEGKIEQLDTNLRKIGWCIDQGILKPTTEDIYELFFSQGRQHDAYVKIKEIFHRAKKSIHVIDPYIDGSIFNLFVSDQKSLEIKLLSTKYPPDFLQEINKFHQQYRSIRIEARKSSDFHDRFIIIDEKECWHIGCSIKDAGNKAFMLSRIEDFRNVEELLQIIHSNWEEAHH